MITSRSVPLRMRNALVRLIEKIKTHILCPIIFFLENRAINLTMRKNTVELDSPHEKIYQGADKSLVRKGRKQARKHIRDARDFNDIETRAVIKFPPTPQQGKAPKEIHAILTETLASFLPGRAKDLSAPL